MPKRTIIVISILILAGNTLLKASPYALVAGYHSDNIVRFDLADGSSEVVVQLEDTARPRGVAVDSQGYIYVGLRGLSQNVKRFTANGTFVDDFTASIGYYGTGHIAFHHSGDLIVAGDSSFNDSILRYNTQGVMVDTFNISGVTNNLALAVDGDYIYSAAYFSGKTARYNLAVNPVVGTVIIDGTELDSPSGITVGHNGNLFIASNGTGLIQEFDAATNAFIGTFVDISSFGEQSTLKDVYFDSITGHYFFTADSRLYEIDSNAQLVDIYANYAILDGAGPIVVVPEPATLALLLIGGLALLKRRGK